LRETKNKAKPFHFALTDMLLRDTLDQIGSRESLIYSAAG